MEAPQAIETQHQHDETLDILMNLGTGSQEPSTPTLPDTAGAGGDGFIADNQLAMCSPKSAVSPSSAPSTASSPANFELSPEYLKTRAVEMYKQENGGISPEPWASPVEEAQWAFRGVDIRSVLGYRKPGGQRFDRALRQEPSAGRISKDLDDEIKLLFKAVWAVNKNFAFTNEKRAASMYV